MTEIGTPDAIPAMTHEVIMKFGFLAVFVCLACIAVSACASPATLAYGQAQVRSPNTWVAKCRGGYDRCGYDGIAHHQDPNPH